MRSGLLGIRWGRQLSRDAGVTAIESTGTADEREARDILERRRIEVYASLAGGRRPALAIAPRAVSLATLAEDFLKAFGAGELPGRRPAANTVALYRALLLGKRGGFIGFAASTGRTTTQQLDEIVVERWLENEQRRASRDTLRLRLIGGRRLVEYGKRRGLVSAETLVATREVPRTGHVSRAERVMRASRAARSSRSFSMR